MQCHLKSKRGINNTEVFWVLLLPKQSEPLDLNHVWTHDGIALHILMVFNLFFKFYSSLISCFTCICLFRIFFKMKISNITLISCYYELKAYTAKSSVNLVFRKGFNVFILNYSCKILFLRKKIKKFWKYRYVSYVISVSLCLHLLFYICMWYEKRRENNTLS